MTTIDRYTGLRNAVIDMLAASDLVCQDTLNRKITRHLNKLIAADERLALALEAAPTFTDPSPDVELRKAVRAVIEAAPGNVLVLQQRIMEMERLLVAARVGAGELGAGALLGDFGRSLMEESIAEDRANSSSVDADLDRIDQEALTDEAIRDNAAEEAKYQQERIEGAYLSEDDGATLYCDTCQQQVRSNEAHTCPDLSQLCTVCKRVPVDTAAGFDTCPQCLSRV